jgi:short-subunit dehydrogenase
MPSPFHDHVVIITGASCGIGRELALQLAGEGASLALASRNAEALALLAAECERRGGRAIALATDIADPQQCQRLIEAAVAAYGRIDVLVNNAGVGSVTKFSELEDLTLFEQVFRVNFYGSVYCTHHALPHLLKSRGRLVAISSLRGLYPSAIADSYGPSKYAMAGFFDSLRIELKGTGVSVTTIYPSWVATGITSRALLADATPLGMVTKHEVNAMRVEVCARIIRRAVASRKREVVMTLKGRFGLWLKLVLPALVDAAVRRDFER